ncbi:MAG: 16S rRNA (guanine(527)-N(7))-methyltransferase RsmG [Bacteroidales bacterium]|nr:16S rRNA (guanine(527)-N(7))-methyltransferase RsmG [Bacteroidales bacterium]
MSIVETYFHELSDTQKSQYDQLQTLYEDWNSKINVVSRKDIGELMTHHVLHSLAIAKFTHFRPGTRVVDVGTGGGFPGIPLAIMFPEVSFTLADSIGKKITVVEEVAKALGLGNVRAVKARSEELREKFDFVTGRGVCKLAEFARMTRHLVDTKHYNNAIMNGILYLKGGDIGGELKPFGRNALWCDIAPYFPDIPFFAEDKRIIHIEI